MYFVNNNEITDPRINLAIETFLLKNLTLDEPILLFYINEPSIIIGRNQNTIEEINIDYVEEKRFTLCAAYLGEEQFTMILVTYLLVLLCRMMAILSVTLLNLQNL